MKMKMGLLALAAAIGFGAAAQAATVTFRFDQATTGWQNTLAYTDAATGLSLTATGKTAEGTAAKVATWAGAGMGACNPLEQLIRCPSGEHQIDSWGLDDIVVLSFDRAVKLTSIAFNYVNKDDTFDLYTGSGANWVEVLTGQPVPALWNAPVELMSAAYGIGAGSTSRQTCLGKGKHKLCFDTPVDSAFKLKSVTVETAAVPLPAAGFMLLGAMAGLGLMRRRKAA